MQHIRCALWCLTGTTAGMATLPFVLLIAPMRALSCLRLPSAPMAATAAARATRLSPLLLQHHSPHQAFTCHASWLHTSSSRQEHLKRLTAVQTGREACNTADAHSRMHCAAEEPPRKAACREESGPLSTGSADSSRWLLEAGSSKSRLVPSISWWTEAQQGGNRQRGTHVRWAGHSHSPRLHLPQPAQIATWPCPCPT